MAPIHANSFPITVVLRLYPDKNSAEINNDDEDDDADADTSRVNSACQYQQHTISVKLLEIAALHRHKFSAFEKHGPKSVQGPVSAYKT